VDVKCVEKLPQVLTLAEIKADSKLTKMKLVQKGNRLSVIPLSKTDFNYLLKKAKV
jgi:predicted RNA-binding protein with PUA-like domain